PGPQDEPDRFPRKIRAGKFSHSEAEVRALMLSYKIARKRISKRSVNERVVLVKGFFPAGFAQYSGAPIALLHLDVDLYLSYRYCLEWFEPLVAQGGVIAFDEYRSPIWA